MLPELGAAIDRVYKRVHTRALPKKRLLIIVGNGIRDVANILNDDKIKVEARLRGYTPGTRAYLDFKWRLFEYARYYTANTLPTYAHCCVHRMLSDKACVHIITTNYDLYFDSIWKKYPQLQIDTNPVASKKEYLWDGYYSPKNSSRRRSYWKIHGSLSHGVFNSSGTSSGGRQLVLLPRMAIPTNKPSIAKAYGLATTSPFLGYEITEFPATVFPDYAKLDATFQPFIDWTYTNRSAFQREIKAVQHLIEHTKEIEAILLIGFRGYYNSRDPSDPWNEEIVPVINRLLAKGFSNIFMAVHRYQGATIGKSTSGLLRERLAKRKAAVYSDAGVWMRNLLSRHTRYFPYNAVDAEHAKWANYYYVSTPEATHI